MIKAQYRRDLFRLMEAALVGLFFVQAIRFLYGTLYAHLSSASLVYLTTNPAALGGQLDVVKAIDVQVELLVVGAALFAPILSIILGRLWFGPAIAAMIVGAGRVFMTANGGTTFGVIGAAIAAGGAALYLTIIAVRRPGIMPAGLIFGFAGDQLVRLYGSTIDMTREAGFLEVQTIISLGLFVIAVFATLFERITPDDAETTLKGEINGWGAFALGGLLYLEFAVLGLPNIVARRAGMDYVAVAPWLVGVTLLPLVAEVRNFARHFLGMFDGRYRGWVWFLTICLLLVIGYRLSGPLAAGMLIATQFAISLSCWWVVQPSDGRRNFSSLGMIFGLIFFLLLTGADFFTYEYAFVRGVQEPFASLLRALRDRGLVITLLATLLVCLPAILSRKRLPWRGGPFEASLAALAVLVAGCALAITFAPPVIMNPPEAPNILRVATLNLHGGYSLYFGSDLPGVARQIKAFGVDVLLLQEVETGRLVSFGIDQPAWLARTLNMQLSYFPTNEGQQGLAILSRLPIDQAQGLLLSSQSKQTGVQFVRLRKSNGEVMDIYNTQLTLLFQGGNLSIEEQEKDQNRQVKEIFDFIAQNKSDDNPLIVGGTFNLGREADIYTYMGQQGFFDPFKDMLAERAVTLRRINEAPVRIDYIWMRHITGAWKADVGQVTQSNHNLAVVEIHQGE